MSKRHVLLICCNKEIMEKNCRSLVEKGYLVSIVTDLLHAERKIISESPDLIVSDLIQSAGSSIDFCNRIRKITSVPILFHNLCENCSQLADSFPYEEQKELRKMYRAKDLMKEIEMQG